MELAVPLSISSEGVNKNPRWDLHRTRRKAMSIVPTKTNISSKWGRFIGVNEGKKKPLCSLGKNLPRRDREKQNRVKQGRTPLKTKGNDAIRVLFEYSMSYSRVF